MNQGNYLGYYQKACADGDAYACFAEHIAANDTEMGHVVTLRLILGLAREAVKKHECLNIPVTLQHIRLDLARDYAAYLPRPPPSETQARWPHAADIAYTTREGAP